MSARRERSLVRWGRHPVVHFALLGAALLAGRDLWLAADGPVPAPQARGRSFEQRAPIVVDAGRLERMRADFEGRWGRPPTAQQLRALVHQEVEEEMLWREARALALDFGDGSVRRRLLEKARAVSRDPRRDPDELLREAYDLGLDDDVVLRRLLAGKMRLLLQQESAGGAIEEAEIAAYRERHRERFEQPGRVTLTHVFLDRARRGQAAESEARALLASLSSSSPPPPASVSDPFPLGQRLIAYTDAQLAGRFSKPFAEQVLALEPGRWSEPLASPYGLHLVRVEERLPPRLAPLDSLRATIRLALAKERAAENLAAGLARLRLLYDVRIEGLEGAVAASENPARHPGLGLPAAAEAERAPLGDAARTTQVQPDRPAEPLS